MIPGGPSWEEDVGKGQSKTIPDSVPFNATGSRQARVHVRVYPGVWSVWSECRCVVSLWSQGAQQTALANELCAATDGPVSSVLPSLPHRLQTQIWANGVGSPIVCLLEMGKLSRCGGKGTGGMGLFSTSPWGQSCRAEQPTKAQSAQLCVHSRKNIFFKKKVYFHIIKCPRQGIL